MPPNLVSRPPAAPGSILVLAVVRMPSGVSIVRPERSKAVLRAVYSVAELAQLAGGVDARRMRKLLVDAGVPIRGRSKGRSGDVTLSDVRRVDPALWDSIVEAAGDSGT